MKIIFTLAVLLALGTMLIGQVAPDKYFIQFTDKNNSPYSINQPEEFLSQRAIDRREKYGIVITEEDLPVNPAYLQGVYAAGAQLLNPTKWMNGVTVFTEDTTVIELIGTLPYVQNVVKLPQPIPTGIDKAYFANETIALAEELEYNSLKNTGTYNYGGAGPQINQINGTVLHDMGYQGQGVVIAVLDGGFSGTEQHPFFDSLWMNNRVLGTKDFVHPGGNVFTESGHGNSVLSTMAAYSPGQMIGTAPQAGYWLLRPEDVQSENVIEEYNWVSAAEFADSVGADVINSSLGYIDFDNPLFNHSYQDMNGATNVSTRGADRAAEKGIVVVNSAGNSGNDPDFPYIGAPADGFNVLSIGAVDPDGVRASFSSIGPTYDGRHKPTIAATGQNTFVAYGMSDAGFGNGTSFSSPVIAGMTACLVQAYPEMTVLEVHNALKQSANQALNPDDLLGWGIPDYGVAYGLLLEIAGNPANGKTLVEAFPNPFRDELNLKLNLDSIELVVVELMSTSGKLVYLGKYTRSKADRIINLDRVVNLLNSGVFYVRVVIPEKTQVIKIIKQ